MKRHGNLFSKIIELDNILYSHNQAKKGKAHYREVKTVETDPRLFCEQIQYDLETQSFTTSEYEIEDIFDGRKPRTIYKLPYYPDRIVQHAVVTVCKPIWESWFIRDTFQSIVGRGTHDAKNRVEKAIKGSKGLYALKFDISKYYPSVNNELLKQIIRYKIKCKNTLWLLDDIIDSCQGLPIGNYTSQYLGNVYLTPFDWWVKQELKVKHYFRYCDDIVVLANSSKECHKIRKAMFDELNNKYHLTIKTNWQVFPVEDRGVDFVGYVFKPSQTRIRNKIAKNLQTKCKQCIRQYMPQSKYINGIMSYWGWCKHANAKKLWNKCVTEQVKTKADKFPINPLRNVMT